MVVPIVVIEVVITPMIIYVMVPIAILSIPFIEMAEAVTIDINGCAACARIPGRATTPIDRCAPWNSRHSSTSHGTQTSANSGTKCRAYATTTATTTCAGTVILVIIILH